jgi:phospholipid N-methyltransferase
MPSLNFLRIAIQDYRRVGALNPTSPYAARRIVKEIKPEHRFVIEYGAGDGVITREILKRLSVDGRLTAVEVNEKFVSELEKIKDDRLTIVHGDVLLFSRELAKSGLQNIDAVISGIPFSSIGLKTKKEIIRNTYHALADSGIFVAYQNSLHILPLLKVFFKNNIWWYFEPRNFLPYFIIMSEKRAFYG